MCEHIKKGDDVITTFMEHNSVIRPLKHLEYIGTIKQKVIKVDIKGFVITP
jgi:cysteine desulfurase / selenocysteine lyase